MWEWSHTDEAYAYAREELGSMTSALLIEIAKDWQDKLESARVQSRRTGQRYLGRLDLGAGF